MIVRPQKFDWINKVLIEQKEPPHLLDGDTQKAHKN